jgi:asparagine synthase (glutamine-hydrolysing)
LSGASKLAAGHILTIRDPLNPPPPASAYWSIENVALAGRAEPFVGDDNDAVAELDSLLREAVSLRMRADVPVGAFLSGGIDSSLVVALMQQCTTAPVRTFTIGFEEQRWDETAYAERVARHIGTSHTTVSLTAQDSLALVQRLPAIFDEPLADPSQLPTFLISQVARKDVTVALCGDGGDELFAGYNRYSRGASLIARASGTPRWLRTRVGQAMASTSSQNWDRSISHLTSLFPSLGILQLSGDRAHKVAAVLGAGSAESMYRGLLSQWQKPRAVVNADERPDAVSHVFSMPDKLSLLDRMMLCDQMSYLPDDLLAKVDRASMAVGLEVRVPILDHRVAEFSWRLPDRMRLRQDASKWILRRVLDKYVPRHLVDRPKMGFSVPINEWLRGPLRRWADDLLYGIDERKDHLLNGAAVVAQWNGFKAGRNHYGMAIWAVLMLEAWRTHWLQQPQIGRPRVRTMAGRI